MPDLAGAAPLIVYNSYPETANLTLEEIDYLFTKEGNKGAKQMFKKTQPVIESLKPKQEIREDLEKNQPELLQAGDSEKYELQTNVYIEEASHP